MTISTVYVFAKSKKALNDALAAGASPIAKRYDSQGCVAVELRACREGTVVKIYENVVGGNPYAKAYGNVAFKKNGALYVK